MRHDPKFSVLAGNVENVRIHIKRGELDASEYVNFPKHLRLRVVLADAMMLGAILVLLSVLGLYMLHE